LLNFLRDIVLHPIHNGSGYNFWSGIGSGSPILAAIAAWWHHHNCATKGCWRKGHPDPEHGHPVCRRHQAKVGA